jgi:hypothetical protein
LSISELIAVNEQSRLDPDAPERLTKAVLLNPDIDVGKIEVVQPSPYGMFREVYHCMKYMIGSGDNRRFFYYSPDYFEGRYNGTKVNDANDFYWSCQRVKVYSKWKANEATFELGLEEVQSGYFDSFVIARDDGPWEKAGPRIQWKLQPGINRLKVAVKNKLGVTGHPWSIVVHYLPPGSEYAAY